MHFAELIENDTMISDIQASICFPSVLLLNISSRNKKKGGGGDEERKTSKWKKRHPLTDLCWKKKRDPIFQTPPNHPKMKRKKKKEKTNKL
jgi:hypothetical protein